MAGLNAVILRATKDPQAKKRRTSITQCLKRAECVGKDGVLLGYGCFKDFSVPLRYSRKDEQILNLSLVACTDRGS